MTVPSSINPYRDTAKQYHKAGWFGVLPLPYKMKESPPTNFTGRMANHPEPEDIEKWINDGKRHNICIRLAGVTKEYAIVGIDVDDYMKGGKKKEGAKQLKAIGEQLKCPLPETWTSSARLDGESGIRFFRVPRDPNPNRTLAFRGKIADDIECIQKTHRYAVVWPSVHPDGGTYWWYPPGVKPNKEGRGAWDGQNLPNARTDLPILPDEWIEYLTGNRMIMPEDGLIDMDTPVDDVYDWAEATLPGEEDEQPCAKMREKLDKHILKLKNSTTFHDPLVNAHWNLLMLAFEGHHGWSNAIAEYEQVWEQNVMDRGGTTIRDLHTMKMEEFRSRTNALRRIKAKSDERVKVGAKPTDPSCQKTGQCGGEASAVASAATGTDQGPTDDVPKGALKGVPDYERNDIGNAKLLYDYFSTVEQGPSMRWVEGYGWIVWHESENPHWERDLEGNQIIRAMWEKCREHQKKYVDALFGDWQQKLSDFSKGLNGVTDQDVKLAANTYRVWDRFVENNGNVRPFENMCKALKSLPMVSMEVNQLDQNKFLLGVGNGILELGEHTILRKARATDFITMNTHVNWEEPSKHSKTVWQDYLDLFLPDPELQRCTQIALGYALMGENPQKKIVVLKGPSNSGKSTMINALIRTMGDYAGPVNSSVFQAKTQFNSVLANSLNKRLVGCSEFDDAELSAAVIKRITGGTDKITLDIKYSNIQKEGVPQFLCVLACNNVPNITGSDKALKNRLHVIPFDVVPNELRPGMDNAVASCTTAILAWLVEGYQRFREFDYLPTTQAMDEARDSFVAGLDEVGAFLHECVATQTSPQGYVTRANMYTNYMMWCDENNIHHKDRLSQTKFTQELKKQGLESPDKKVRVDGKIDRWWFGVKMQKAGKVLRMPNMSQLGSGTTGTESGTAETPGQT